MNGINRTPFLSICIPTYNRAEHVFSMVNEILNCPTEEIEVIVLDNCSTDSTKDLLNSILDKRLVFIQNPYNIGGVSNSIKVLTIANGEYALLCLDRDHVECKNIPSFIQKLHQNKDIVMGFSSFELNENISDMIFKEGFDSVLNMAFLSKHPSGNFYKTNVLNNLKRIKETNINSIEFAFYHELINSEISFLGRTLKINTPMISAGYLNSKEDFAINKSHSYNTSNYYFIPSKRKIEYFTYISNTSKLNLSSKEKKHLYLTIFLRGLISSTFAFKKDMMNSKICSHYNIPKRKVTFPELLRIDLDYLTYFLNLPIGLGIFSKIYISVLAHLRLSNYFIKSFIKKYSR